MSDLKKNKHDKFDYATHYLDKPKSGLPAEELIGAARLEMLIKHPFFAKMAMNLTIVESEAVPTTAVDARGHLFFNRKWVNHFQIKDAIWATAHETMHLVLRHLSRFPAGANPYIWNLAADYVLETMLFDAGLEQSEHSKYKTTPERQEMVKRVGYTTPAVYKHLLQEMEQNTDCPGCKSVLQKLRQEGEKHKKDKQSENAELNSRDNEGNNNGEEGQENKEQEEGSCKSNAEGCNNPNHNHGQESEPEHTCGLEGPPCCSGILSGAENLDPTEEQAWIERVVGAKIHAESKGNMPAALGEYIDTLTQSKVRWQDYLKAAATRLFGRDRYTYKRTNRRGPAICMRLPGHTPDGKTAIGAIDTSASMSCEEVRQCISEFSAIMKACGCHKLWLILHDSRVYYSGWVEEADLTKLEMARGGTSHKEVFQILYKKHSKDEFNIPHEEEVTLAILFTDLGTDFPDEVPNFDVIWGVPSNGNPGMLAEVPFGLKVEVEVNG